MNNFIINFLKKYKTPIAIYVASRLIIFLVILMLNAFGVENSNASLIKWDAINYISIAQDGYHFSGDYLTEYSWRIVFFPLMPILVSTLHLFTHIHLALAGMILANILSLGSVLLLYKLLMDWKGKETAVMGVMLLVFYPTSFFLSSVYSESVFLFLTLLAFYSLNKNRVSMGILAVSLACIARMNGGVLALLWLWEIWKKSKNIFKTIIYGALISIPFLVFLYFQYRMFGTPFAFLGAQAPYWSQHIVWPWEGVWRIIERAFFDVDYKGMWRMDLIYIIVAITTLIMSFKHIPRNVWMFGAGMVLLTICSSRLLGMGRYVMMVLPLYYYWGNVLSTKKHASLIVIATSAAFLAITTALFALGKTIF